MGTRCPENVQVTGIGDNEFSQVITPRLTTVHHHYKTSGAEAAKMLMGIMTGSDSVPREVKMGYEVVERASTRAAVRLARGTQVPSLRPQGCPCIFF